MPAMSTPTPDHLPPYTLTQPPSSGYRIPLTITSPFPPAQATNEPCAYDADGRSPVFFGSALFSNSVHPCKIVPNLTPTCRVAYGGSEYEHHGRYDLLPFDSNTMELVPASGGHPPTDRRMVEGGYEDNGNKLYHAIAYVGNVRVPGKAGQHLGGANVAFGGAEHQISDYLVLCWRN